MDDLEWIELRAVLDFFAAAPPEVAHALDLAVLELDGAGAFSIGAYRELLLFNRVLGLDEHDRISEVEAWFQSRGCRFAVSASPGSALEPPLGDRGYRVDQTYVKFRRRASPPEGRPTSLRIEQLGAEDAEAFGEAVAGAFGMAPSAERWFSALPARSGWGCFGAFDDNRCVSTALARVEGKLGWLGAAVTQPEARGRGGQSALLAARIRWAGAAGADVLALETRDHADGEARGSFRNVRRAGFEAAYRQRW